MSKFSNHLETALFNATLRGVSYTSPTTVYLSLHTADPTDDGSGAEVSTSGTDYIRQAVTFGAPTDGVGSNSGTITFPVALIGWGTCTHFGLWDAETGGNLLYFGAMTPSHTVTAASQLQFPAGAVQVTLL